MSYFIEGFKEAIRLVMSVAELSVSVVMLMASFETFMQGYVLAGLFFIVGSCALLRYSVYKAWALVRPDKQSKVTP